MNPIVSIWPMPSTALLAGRVGDIMRRTLSPGAPFASILSQECGDNLSSRIEELHRSMLSLDADAPSLFTFVILPLSDSDTPDTLAEILRQLQEARCELSVHVLALHASLSRMTTEGNDGKSDSKTAVESLRKVIGNFPAARATLSVIDDYSQEGNPVNFDIGTLARFLASVLKVFMENIPSIFTQTIVGQHGDKISAIGFAGAELGTESVIDYLLHKAFIHVLELEGMSSDNEVSLQVCQQRAERCLSGLDTFYDDFYSKEVGRRLDEHKPHSAIVAEIDQPLRDAIDALYTRFTSPIHDKSLRMVDKEATMALIAGRDNENLGDYLFIQNDLAIDDAISKPLDLYIGAFNEHGAESGLLPLRGAYPRIRRNDKSIEDQLTDKNNEAFNPISDIKRLRREILDVTSFIRKGCKTLDQLSRSHDADQLRNVVVRHTVAQLPEKPLELVYEPSSDLTLAPSVDLRPFFNEVKDQGEIGACSTFAVVSMYEYLLNRSTTENVARRSLSEGFLFYHTNVKNGRGSGGSNFYEQIKAMGETGTCILPLYDHWGDDEMTPPGEEALSEAKMHRIVQARQIPLMSGDDKYTAIRHNHRLITSALSEGYPVGISLQIFSDFGTAPGGHVARPSEEIIAAENGEGHAMVVVGYSEADNCYVVRNSWGKDFGDNGYCYISASYVDDADLNRFACIITKTTEEEVVKRVPPFTMPFAGNENNIRAASISNSLDEAKIRQKALSDKYNEYFRYYCDLRNRLSQPFTRQDIWRMAESKCKERLQSLAFDRHVLIESFPDELKAFKKNYISIGGSIFSVFAFFVLCCSICNYFMGSVPTWLIITTAVACAVFFIYFVNYFVAVKRKRMKLDEEIKQISIQAGETQRDLETKQLQFHMAGLVIDHILSVIQKVEERYIDLVTFNANLRQWYLEDKDKELKALDTSDKFMLSLADSSRLNKFFESNVDQITREIDLTELFGQFKASMGNILVLRSQVEDAVRKVLQPMFETFSITDFLSGTHYAYVDAVSLDETMRTLDRRSSPLLRHCDNDTENEVRYLIAYASDSRRDAWRALCSNHFAYAPSFLSATSKDSLYILSLRLIDPSMVS